MSRDSQDRPQTRGGAGGHSRRQQERRDDEPGAGTERPAAPSRAATGGARARARRAALQALYQWQITRQPPREVVEQFRTDRRLRGLDETLFVVLVDGVPAHLEALDASLAPVLDRPLAEVDLVERAILRLCAYELLHRHEVPWRVIVSQGVDLAHVFGAEQGHRFVNGVLDRLARVVRPGETRCG